MLTAWWTALGADTRIGPDFSGATVTVSNANDLWDAVKIEDCGLFYQRTYGYESDYVPEDGGYFYLENTATDELTPSADCWFDTPDRLSYDVKSAIRLLPLRGGLVGRDQLPVMLTSGASDDAIVKLFMTTSPNGEIGSWGPFHLKHYQPWAWHGKACEVIPSIIMQLGIGTSYIDTDGFDSAYPVASTYRLNLIVSREYGVPVIDTIKEVARHWFDLVGYSMSGQITMKERTYVNTLGAAGVKSMTWRYAPEHLCNHMVWSHGAYTMADGWRWDAEGPTAWNGAGTRIENNDEYSYKTTWNDNLANARKATPGDTATQDFELEVEVTASTTKYGDLPLGGFSIVPDGPLVATLSTTHHRYQYERIRDLVLADDFVQHIVSNAKLRREVTVVQDLRGLDFDICNNVQFSLGGDTEADFTCIRKSIDFDTLTVTSVLLEE